MKLSRNILLLILIFLSLYTDAQKLTLTVASQQKRLSLQELSGKIFVQGYKGNQIIITLTNLEDDKNSRKSTDIGVEVKLSEQEIILVGQLREHAKVYYTIMMPEQMLLKSSRSCKRNGEIEVKGLVNECEINNCENIYLEKMSGPLVLNAISGDIIIKSRTQKWKGPSYVSTTSGDIVIEFPPDFNAIINAESLMGKVSSDFSLQSITEKEAPIIKNHRLEGAIGKGGSFLSLSNISGKIFIKKVIQ